MRIVSGLEGGQVDTRDAYYGGEFFVTANLLLYTSKKTNSIIFKTMRNLLLLYGTILVNEKDGDLAVRVMFDNWRTQRKSFR